MQGVQSVSPSSCQWDLREGWHSWVAVSWLEDGLIFFELGVRREMVYVPTLCCLR